MNFPDPAYEMANESPLVYTANTPELRSSNEPGESSKPSSMISSGESMDIPSTYEDSNVWMESVVPATTPFSTQSITRGNAFVQLVQGWETYMNDDRLIDPFPTFQQPFEMLQGLSLCGHPASEFSSLKQGVPDFSTIGHPFAPAALRHTHSSPSQINGRSNFAFGSSPFAKGENTPPPPIALDPFQRSTSTPSAFRQHSNYSAFGTADGSAFTLPSPRYTGTSSMSRESSSFSAFGPVQFYSMALENMERTSIEVQDITNRSDDGTVKQKVGIKRGAASRAARFLSDVRVLRRRRRARGGRENPAQPTSISSRSKFGDDDEEDVDDEHETSHPLDTAVTVVTETLFNPNDTSFLSGSSEISALIKETELDGANDSEDQACVILDENLNRHGKANEDGLPSDQQYHQLDSDPEEEIGYQRIETQLQSVSPPLPPTAVQHGFFAQEKHANPTPNSSYTAKPLRVHVSSSQKPRFSMAMESVAASPSPTRMERGGEGSSLTPLSLEYATTSPHTTRSSYTGSSSGHTTQATITSFNTGLQSGLSTISETDREVMQANKDAKRRRGLDSLPTVLKGETDGSSNNSSSSTSTNPHRYFSLASSPVTLREGAKVPVDRFFTESPPLACSHSVEQALPLLTANTLASSSTAASRNSGSTTSPSSESLPVTHTSSSSSSSGAVLPPTFVSYIDRESSSDLTSFREAMETSSPRDTDNVLEEREASPASEMMSYSTILFEESNAPSQQNRGARLDRFRSLQRPPRSPAKVVRMAKTPPPHGYVFPINNNLSPPPPRDIVDHLDLANDAVLLSSFSLSDGNNLGLPMTNPADRIAVPLVGTKSESDRQMDIESLVKQRTYQERNIEVTNTAPTKGETVASIVTPEK